MELWRRQMTYHLVPWNSMELWDCHSIQCHATLEFHGIYYGIPWNSIEWPNKKSPSSMGFHGIRRAPLPMTQVFHGIPWNIPWNSMELWCRQMTYHLAPWNSMEPWHCHFMAFYPGWTSKWYSMEFQGTLESSNKNSPTSMRFHGIKRAPLQMTQIFHGIPWNIQWNSMELWCRQMTYYLVPWNSMEFHGTLVSLNEVSLTFMEFHGTLRSQFYGI